MYIGFCDTVKHDIDGFLFTPGNSENAREYINRLKVDKDLRIEMGKRGRDSVCSKTMSHVIEDLIQWYAQGISNRKKTSIFKYIASVTVLLILVPFGIFALACYDSLMVILALCGYSPAEAIKEKSC